MCGVAMIETRLRQLAHDGIVPQVVSNGNAIFRG
jgi:hypothetical protein